MGYRNYGERGREWEPDREEQARYGRDSEWREYYADEAGEATWDRGGPPGDFGGPIYPRHRGRVPRGGENWARGRGRGAPDEERGGREGTWGGGRGEFGDARGEFGRERGSAWLGGAGGAHFPEPYYSYGRFGTYGEPYYGRGAGGYGGTSEREGVSGYRTGQRETYGPRGRRGNFAGRGPKGWRRSDARIAEEVSEALARHPDVDASDLEVHVENGVVALTGVVEDRDEKRLVEDIAEDVFGVHDVENRLKIRHGFLAGITGEKAEERELPRHAAREPAGGRDASASGTKPTATTGSRTTSGTRPRGRS